MAGGKSHIQNNLVQKLHRVAAKHERHDVPVNFPSQGLDINIQIEFAVFVEILPCGIEPGWYLFHWPSGVVSASAFFRLHVQSRIAILIPKKCEASFVKLNIQLEKKLKSSVYGCTVPISKVGFEIKKRGKVTDRNFGKFHRFQIRGSDLSRSTYAGEMG